MPSLDWLHGITENDNPLPAIGRLVHAERGVVGLAVGYRQNTSQERMCVLVQDVTSGKLVEVKSHEVISSTSVEDYVAAHRPAQPRRPELKLVHSA